MNNQLDLSQDSISWGVRNVMGLRESRRIRFYPMNELIFLSVCVGAVCLGSGLELMGTSDFLQRNQ